MTETEVESRFHDGLERMCTIARGENLWCWIAPRRRGGRPFVITVARSQDSQGSRFAKRVWWAQDRLAARNAVRGVLHRAQGGTMTFTTNDSVADVQAAHAALCQWAPLDNLLILQVNEAGIADARLAVNYTVESAILRSLKPKQSAWCYLVDISNTPRLFIDTDRDALKERAVRLSRERCLRGRLTRTRRGSLRIQTVKCAADTFQQTLERCLPTLVGWPAFDALKTVEIVPA